MDQVTSCFLKILVLPFAYPAGLVGIPAKPNAESEMMPTGIPGCPRRQKPSKWRERVEPKPDLSQPTS